MKSVVQPVRGGPVEVLDVPRPTAAPTEVLVRTIASVSLRFTDGSLATICYGSALPTGDGRGELDHLAMTGSN